MKEERLTKQEYKSNVTHIASAPPLRLTIDCSDERIPTKGSPLRSSFNTKKDLNIHSFCNLIHKAIPKAVKDGKFVHYDPDDQLGFGDTQMPIAITPPKGFIPDLGSTKFKVPKIRIPVLNVPKLQASMVGTKKPPKVGAPVTVISSLIPNDDSSAEKMEKLKKGVQKMLHFVKVLGQIDQYLTERIRIVVDKISKTFTE